MCTNGHNKTSQFEKKDSREVDTSGEEAALVCADMQVEKRLCTRTDKHTHTHTHTNLIIHWSSRARFHLDIWL